MDFRLYLAQRVSAIVMAPLVLGHLAVMIYAIQGGLSAAEILGRTQGSLFWGVFYGLFVIAAAVHASIGVSTVASEWLGLRGRGLAAFGWALFAILLAMGMQAVYAVVAT